MCNGAGKECEVPRKYDEVHARIQRMNAELEEISKMFDEVNEQRRQERAEFDKLGVFEQFKRAVGWSS